MELIPSLIFVLIAATILWFVKPFFIATAAVSVLFLLIGLGTWWRLPYESHPMILGVLVSIPAFFIGFLFLLVFAITIFTTGVVVVTIP
jgi:hypothetical protein